VLHGRPFDEAVRAAAAQASRAVASGAAAQAFPPGSADVSGDDRPPREVPLVKLAPAVAGAASLALEQPADLVAAVAALPEVAGLARSLYDGRPL